MIRRLPTVRQIEDALDVLANSARDKGGELVELLEDKYSDIRGALHDANRTLHRTTRHAWRRANRMKTTGTRRMKEMAETVNDQVHEGPWRAIGWMAGGAFLAGLLLGSRHNRD